MVAKLFLWLFFFGIPVTAIAYFGGKKLLGPWSRTKR